jgi:hypothetical protein
LGWFLLGAAKAEIATMTPTPNTNTSSRSDFGDLTPERYEYVSANKIRLLLRSRSGDVVAFTMTTAMLAHSVNLAVQCMNSNAAQVLKDLEVFS